MLDTCGDGDGGCARDQGAADELIDVERFASARWGVPDHEDDGLPGGRARARPAAGAVDCRG